MQIIQQTSKQTHEKSTKNKPHTNEKLTNQWLPTAKRNKEKKRSTEVINEYLGYLVRVVLDDELCQLVEPRRSRLHHEEHLGVFDDLTLPGVDGRDPGHYGHARRQFVGHQPARDFLGWLVVWCRGEHHWMQRRLLCTRTIRWLSREHGTWTYLSISLLLSIYLLFFSIQAVINSNSKNSTRQKEKEKEKERERKREREREKCQLLLDQCFSSSIFEWETCLVINNFHIPCDDQFHLVCSIIFLNNERKWKGIETTLVDWSAVIKWLMHRNV